MTLREEVSKFSKNENKKLDVDTLKKVFKKFEDTRISCEPGRAMVVFRNQLIDLLSQATGQDRWNFEYHLFK